MPDFASNILSFPNSHTYTIYQDGGVVNARNNKTGVITSNATLDPLVTTILASGDPNFEVQPGIYNLSGGFGGWELPSYSQAYLHPGTIINVPNAYATYVWKQTPSSGIIQGAIVDGGFYSEAGATPGYNWFLIELAPTSTGAVMNNTYQNMNVEKCYCMIHPKSNGTTAWINSNTFRNIWGYGPRYGVLFEHVGTYAAGGSGPNGNKFDNVSIQALTPGGGNNIIGGVIGVYGQFNTFVNCNIWDITVVSTNATPSLTIDANSDSTLIVGGALAQPGGFFTDNGVDTMIFDKWQGLYNKNVTNLKDSLNITIPATATETFFNFTASDASGDSFALENSTTTNGMFGSIFRQTLNSTAIDQWTAGIWFQTLIKTANDIAASTACNVISAHNVNSTLLANRAILDIWNKFTPCYTFYPSYADFTNKELRNASGIAQNAVYKRWGSYQPIVPTTGSTAAVVGNLEGILMAHVPTGPGTNTNTWDTTEGLLTNLVTTTTINQNAGLVSPTGSVAILRRAFAAKMVYRGKIDTVAAGVARLYFGVSSNSALNISDTIANGDSLVLVGFKAGDANYSIYYNDGSGAHVTTAITGSIAKNTNFHTIIIEWTAGGNVVVTFDGVSQTISADLPATTTNLFFHCLAQNATAAIRTHSIKGVWVESA